MQKLKPGGASVYFARALRVAANRRRRGCYVFALGDKKNIRFMVFLCAGTTKALRLLCFLRSKTKCAPRHTTGLAGPLRTNTLGNSRNPMRTAVWRIILYYIILYIIRRPPCGAHGCEDDCCIQSVSTVSGQQTVSSCHCPVYCSPPLMVPRQARDR